MTLGPEEKTSSEITPPDEVATDENSPQAGDTVTATTEGIEQDEKSKDIHRTALVVEDSKLIRRTLCMLLKNRRLDTIEADNGQIALQKIQEVGLSSIDIIFLDMMMPEMDGLAFMRAAREAYAKDLPPVIACSAVSDKRVIKEMAPLGISGYILKPFKSEMIFRKLESLFPDLAS